MKHRNILFSVLVIAAIAAMAMALVPPPPVNQNIGINDSRFDKLGSSPQMPNQSGCRVCHSAGVPDRHHNLVPAGKINPVTGSVYACNNCHPTISGGGILLDRECLDCHSGLNFSRLNASAVNAKVNISRPHHVNTAEAAARDCRFCHGSFVANTDDGHYVPSYATSIVTPTTHYKIYNETSGRYWGGCFACHQNSTANIPELLNQHDTHHGAINGNRTGLDKQKLSTPGETCNWCHTVNVSSPTGRPVGYPDELAFEIRNSTLLNIGDTLNGTGCEKCHDVGTLHNIQYNYATTNGQQGYGHIGDNGDCNGCHAFWDAGDVSGFEGAIIPDVTSISQTKFLTTDTATPVTISGTNFLSGAGTFTAVVAIDGTTKLTPNSVTDTEIVVTIPQLTEGVHTIQVVKQGDPAGDKSSRLGSLTIVSQVDVVKAKLASGTITITGTEFGPQPTADFADLGVFVTHTATVKRKTTTTTFEATVVSWADTQIVVNAGTAAVNDKLTVKTLNGQDYTNTVKK